VLIAYSAVVPDVLARLFPVRYGDVLKVLQPGSARRAMSRPAARDAAAR
jgi:hypothetical protein